MKIEKKVFNVNIEKLILNFNSLLSSLSKQSKQHYEKINEI